MSSRQTILRATRRHLLPAVALPNLDRDWQTFPDDRAAFVETLKAVGGEAMFLPNAAAIDAELARRPVYASASQIVSLVPGVGSPNVDPAAAARPHDLADVDYAILPGRFGVAENAAIWLDLREAGHRVICVLAQHLAIVLPASQIVPTMHAAYARLAAGDADFGQPGFGMFISGPSKTADIEQSLVIGAHGARSLTVFLVED